MFRVIQGVRKVRQTETGYEDENNKKTHKIKCFDHLEAPKEAGADSRT